MACFQSGEVSISGHGGWDGMPYIIFSFVANVNRNYDKLKANVNHFDNGNVWNAEYRCRLVLPKLIVSPAY